MAAYEVIVKRLEPLRVITLSEDLTGVDEIRDACGRMYPQLHAAWRGTVSPLTVCPSLCTRTPELKQDRFA